MASHTMLNEMTHLISLRAVTATTLLAHPHFPVAVVDTMTHKIIPDSKDPINSVNRPRITIDSGRPVNPLNVMHEFLLLNKSP